jgi:hypothetical protein
MKVKVTKVNVANLNALIKKMLLMDTSLYINIGKGRVWSSVYTPTKDVVKSFSLPTDDVFTFEKPVEDIIKLSFFSGSRLANCIGHFDPHHLSMEISTFKDEDEGVLYADKIVLRDQKLKIEIHCQDTSLGFTSMTDEQMQRAFDKSTELFSFQFSREDFTKVTSLFTLDKKELLEITGESDGVHIKTDAFDIIIDDNKYINEIVSKSTFKVFFDRVDKETYDVSICENKLILASQESQTIIALNLAITE